MALLSFPLSSDLGGNNPTFNLLKGSVVFSKPIPTAVITAVPAYGVIGSIIKLDGRQSSDTSGNPLTYTWSFIDGQIPTGSLVAQEGFKVVDSDSSVVSFSPDVVGEYIVGLVVSNGLFSSAQVVTRISIRAIMVPHGRGLVPDGKFIWSYIRDVWANVEGKEWFETLWSCLVQIAGAELLTVYQNDFNKSIRDIQDKYQRRWLAYSPRLDLIDTDLSFYITGHCAGTDASTKRLGLSGQAIITTGFDLILTQGTLLSNVIGQTVSIQYSNDVANVKSYNLVGVNASKTGYKLQTAVPDTTADTLVTPVTFTFSYQSTTWTQISGSTTAYTINDIIVYPSGPNAGFYRVKAKNGSTVTVDKQPRNYSDAITSATYTATIYRPVGIVVTQPDSAVGNTFSVTYNQTNDLSYIASNRIVSMGNKSYVVQNTVIDNNQIVPSTVVSTKDNSVPTGLTSLNWRAPHTLVSASQNFEDLGITPGDLLVVDVINAANSVASQVRCQITAVSTYSVGVVLTDQVISPGIIPPIPGYTYTALGNDFGINGITVNADKTVSLSSQASDMLNYILSIAFKKTYGNVPLTTTSPISVGGFTFTLRPRYVIRNSKIQVDPTLRSVPTLQEWINQPNTTTTDGINISQISNGQLFPLQRVPSVLFENSDYIIDDEKAFSGTMSFIPGSNIVNVLDASFVDRGITPGDSFIIDAPLTLAGTYTIASVISPTQITLVRPIPAYNIIFSNPTLYVNPKVRIIRKKTGRYLRFAPGGYNIQNPAPDRLWAEVSLLDNGNAIENNFGILVGLTQKDLATITSNTTYRQAVIGLMYAMTKGSAVNKIRLGAQILLGLPFSEHRGIIRSIDSNYRLDINGNAILGRIFMEDVDNNNTALGIFRVYTYPIDISSDLSGIETNKLTNLPYKVGDIVEAYSLLCKGVSINDYKTNPIATSAADILQVQQFQQIRVRINDRVFGPDEIDLVSSFLRKITPSYVAYTIAQNAQVADSVSVNENVSKILISNEALFTDNASFSIPTPLMFDTRIVGGSPILLGDGVFIPRRKGADLVATATSSTLTIASGFLNPKVGEVFESPFTRVGDKIYILSGTNKGLYTISALTDTSVTVSDGPVFGFAAATGQVYAVLRPVSSLIRSSSVVTDSVSTTNASSTLSFATGALRSDGVSVGDWILVVHASGTKRYTIIGVHETVVGSGVFNQVDVSPTPSITEATRAYLIYRPTLFEAPSSGTYSITANGTNTITTTDLYLKALLDTGDEIQLQQADLRRSTVLDPTNLYITPTISAGTYNVKIVKKNRITSTGPISWNQMQSDPSEFLEMRLDYLTGNGASTTASSAVVTLTAPITNPSLLNIKPGDFFKPILGADSSVDIGYGAGVYPIAQVSSTNITLTVALTATTTTTYKFIRRR